MMKPETKSYFKMVSIPSFEGRLEYLKTDLPPSHLTFGLMRELNQKFYRSREWHRVRKFVIARDLGHDLGCPGYDIVGRVIVHHMNPLLAKDILHQTSYALDPDHLITVSHNTHLAIHYNTPIRKIEEFVERQPGDTNLW